MHEIKSFKIFQTARIAAAVYSITAVIFAVVFAIVALLHGHPVRAIMGIIFIPILYGLGGLIMISWFCWVYNQVASRIGGIAFELAPHTEK